MLPTAHNNHSAIMKRAEKAETAMAEYVKHYRTVPSGAQPLRTSHRAQADGRCHRRGPRRHRAGALTAVENRLKSLNADVQVEQEEYDEVVVIKAMFLNHDYQ